ncbi:MAG TPA: class I SAM-dependent methyltransferase [Trebonia sp.]|jgi:SAM-dependent methyltransferase|nr:class I SAM-dependent methyltransferase [Trebonia sp.]
MSRAVTIDRAGPAYRGHAAYSRGFLLAYDALVYGVNSPLAWRCPLGRLVALYDECASARHIDVGVATGILLDRCTFPSARPSLTLMDLNPNSLAQAGRRLRRYAPRACQASVLDPWPLPPGSAGSVAMCNLIHCLPGSIPDKAVAFRHARTALAPGGVLFGSTILGHGPRHTWLARRELAAANLRGFMSNTRDGLEDLDRALGREFCQHEITIAGSVALFRARR